MKYPIYKFIDSLLILFLFYLLFYKLKIFLSFIWMIITIQFFVFLIQIVRNLFFHNRLNELYTYTYLKKANEYEIHYDPIWIIHYIDKNEMIFFRSQAIHKLKSIINNPVIIGKTMTIHSINQSDERVIEVETYSKVKRFFAIIPSVFLTIFNVYNLHHFSLARKIYLLLFISPFKKYRYL